MPDTIDSLRNQRDALAEALGKLLQAYGIVRTDVAMTGPELLMVAEEATRDPISDRFGDVYADEVRGGTSRIR